MARWASFTPKSAFLYCVGPCLEGQMSQVIHVSLSNLTHLTRVELARQFHYQIKITVVVLKYHDIFNLFLKLKTTQDGSS